jgi:hypothetical protein
LIDLFIRLGRVNLGFGICSLIAGVDYYNDAHCLAQPTEKINYLALLFSVEDQNQTRFDTWCS